MNAQEYYEALNVFPDHLHMPSFFAGIRIASAVVERTATLARERNVHPKVIEAFEYLASELSNVNEENFDASKPKDKQI
jgi:hypothetical protein